VRIRAIVADGGAAAQKLQRMGCREMDFTGRPARGFAFVGPEGTGTNEGLRAWIALALDFNERAKSSKKRK
jgi:hypothetical protein